MDARRRPLLQLTSCVLVVAQFAGAVPAFAAVAPAKPVPNAPAKPAAAAAVKPSALVSRAQGFYRDGRYDEALGLLAGPILRKELAGDDLREARIVLARCYVKKGMLPRAKEHFGALLAAEPTFVLTSDRADTEELAVFSQVRGVVPPVAAKPEGSAAPGQVAPASPTLHKPTLESGATSRPGWLARNKYLALAVVAGGGLALGLAGGGGGDGAAPPRPRNLAGFPAPPGGH